METVYLSEREYNCIYAASFGLRNREIASRFGMRRRTVESCMNGAYVGLGMDNACVELGINKRIRLPIIFSQDYFFKIKLHRKNVKKHKWKCSDTFKYKFAIHHDRFSIVSYALLNTDFKLLKTFLLCYEFF